MFFGLIRDFKRDKGLNKKAKVFHSILLSLLIFAFAGAFSKVGWVIRNFDLVQTFFGIDVGIVSGSIHLVIYVLDLILSLFVLVFAYQMISRKDKARKRIVFFLPFLAVTSVFNFYRGWLNDGGDILINDYLILLIGIIFFGSATVIYLLVYNSNYMKTFFNFKPEAVDKVIDEIGT